MALELAIASRINSDTTDKYLAKIDTLLAEMSAYQNAKPFEKKFQIDMRDENDCKHIVQLMTMAQTGEKYVPPKDEDEDEDIENAKPTVKKNVGGAIKISIDSFDVNRLRFEIREKLKKGAGSLTLTVSQTPADMPGTTLENLGLLKQQLKGPKDQCYFTVGDNWNNDIIVPKASLAVGTLFGVSTDGGKFYFKDFSDIDIELTAQLKLGNVKKGEEPDIINALRQNDIVSFYNNTLYLMRAEVGENCEMDLIKEKAIESGENYLPPPAEVRMAVPADGLIVSKLKSKVKVTLKHPLCSGTHARFVPGGIVDHSTNGTFAIYKYRDGFVQIMDRATIYMMDYEFSVGA